MAFTLCYAMAAAFFALTFASTAMPQSTSGSQQKAKTVKSWSGNALSGRTVVPIPKADSSCSPSECEWWERMRSAAYNLQLKDDGNSKRNYATILAEGLEKAYRPPIADRAAMLLSLPPFALPPNIGRRGYSPKKSAEIKIELEIRADGSVGEMKVVKSFNEVYDRLCLSGKRQSIFLPAVKDRQFVASSGPLTCTYSY